ncbi:hypothetical protein OG349_01530 [Streptomyces sp. NBC_01317]|uniref:hypothetical protein n=1 Tax=Streptomyces sp. NBC_01317 TaxID=2903822 RepID=UPI002E0D899C|nr:hypothetical protein OG349_01530 [Streptomyces sp. NBC_01317]
MTRLTDPALLAALSRRPYCTATYRMRHGVIDPAAGSAWMTRPYAEEEEEEFGRTVREAVGTWLRTSDPSGGGALSVTSRAVSGRTWATTRSP